MIHDARRIYGSGGPSIRAQQSQNQQDRADWRVERILNFLDSNDGKLGWDLDHLCRQLDLGISGSHAAKLFGRHIGIGIREYSKQLRLELAAQQLCSTTVSVKRIALELGYRTPNDLRRQFKRLFSLTPTEFRTANRQPGPAARSTAAGCRDNGIRFNGGNRDTGN